MKKDINDIVLSYSTHMGIVIRIISIIVLGFVLFGICYVIYEFVKGKYSKCMNIIEIVGIIGLPFILILAISLFIDSWKIIVFNEQIITVYIIGIKISTLRWLDINEVEMGKTNQFRNFIQCKMLCLYAIDKKKVTIPVELECFDQFYHMLKSYISNIPDWSKDEMHTRHRRYG